MKLDIFNKNKLTDDEIRNFFNDNINEMFDEEIKEIFKEMEYGPHADDPTYTKMVENLEKLIEAKNDYNKNEFNKNNRSEESNDIDPNVIVPILVKAGLSLAVIVFWLGLEKNHMIPSKLVNWSTNLLIPR